MYWYLASCILYICKSMVINIFSLYHCIVGTLALRNIFCFPAAEWYICIIFIWRYIQSLGNMVVLLAWHSLSARTSETKRLTILWISAVFQCDVMVKTVTVPDCITWNIDARIRRACLWAYIILASHVYVWYIGIWCTTCVILMHI